MATTAAEIDQQARERAEDRIADLKQKIGEVEAVSAWLAGFVGSGNLGSAAVGTIGIKAGEMREQLPAIRQAVRDLDPTFEA